MKPNAERQFQVPSPRASQEDHADRPHFETIDRLNYPRPQFYRPSYQILNGQWQFAFDDNNVGLAEKWEQKTHNLDGTINVPYPYQSPASGIDDQSVHETGWYKLNMTLPAGWKNNALTHDRVHVHFESIDYHSDIFLNGDYAWSNEGGQVPFSIDATPYFSGDHDVEQITIRAVDKEDGDQPRGKQVAVSHDMYYTNTSFVWKPVWIESVPETHFNYEGFRMTPSAEEKLVDFEMPITLAHNVASVEIEAFDADDPEEQCVARVAGKPKSNGARLRLQMPENVKLWSPDNPSLYNIRMRLKDTNGDILDEVLTYTGLRDIDVKPEGLYINGEHQFVIGVLRQGYWPATLMSAPSGEALKQDVEWAKACGYNTVRQHQKREDERYNYFADKMGLMVWSEMPNAQSSSVRGQRRTLDEFSRSIDQDFNHPCVVMRVPANESFDSPGLRDGWKQEDTYQQALINVSQQKDPTRPAVTDGWHHTSTTRIIGIHDYAATGDELRSHYVNAESGDFLRGCSGTSNCKVMAHGARYTGQPIILTELGGFMYNPPEESGMNYVRIKGEEEYLAKYRDILQAVKDSKIIAGFVHTQDCHVQHEKNGMCEEDHTSIIEPANIKAVHASIFNRDDMLSVLGERKSIVEQAARSFNSLSDCVPAI